MDQNQMRIQVNPDGNVEFSVSLSGAVDPSMVASMVAAVRRGIVASSAPPPLDSPALPPSPLPLQPSPPSPAHQTPPDPHPEPTSDQDNPRAPDRVCDRVPSPLVVSAARKLSVRQIAAEIDARPDSALPTPYTEYDPVREFSSSPALWLTNDHPYPDPDPPRSQSSAYSLRASASDCDVNPARRLPPDQPPNRVVETVIQQPQRTPPPTLNKYSSARPFRMLSLPTATNTEVPSDMYFARHQSEHTADHTLIDQPTRPREKSNSMAALRRGDPLADTTITEAENHHGHLNSPSSQRSISDVTDSQYLDQDAERSITPTSPYVQQSDFHAEDPDDAWNDVEYVLTESYRNEPKPSSANDRDSHVTPTNSRSAAWRLFSSIGTSLRRRPDLPEDIHQSTLASGSGFSDRLPKRRRALFTRNNVRNGTLWMEFTSPLSVERMLAEVGKIAKAMGYQVWRRPGENKLRCIRRLNHRHEMHLVILVGSIRLPEGQVSVVRLRRARGDRNRTEGWRYAHFYRELIDRLQRHGIVITAGE